MSRPFGSASTLELRRRQAVQAVQTGDSVKDVARIIGVNPRSIYRWLKLAEQPDGLDAKPHSGPAPRLSFEQQQKLEEMLLQGAHNHGWPNQLWTTQRIADLIRRHFGISRPAFYKWKKRFEAHGERYFRFVTTPDVEPTNNLAEQAIRFVARGLRKGKRRCCRAGTAMIESRPSVASRSVRNGPNRVFISRCCPTMPTRLRKTSLLSCVNSRGSWAAPSP